MTLPRADPRLPKKMANDRLEKIIKAEVLTMKNIYMRFPGGVAKALTLSYDDGVHDDYRLIEIMRRNGLCGTFNINSGMFGDVGRNDSRLTAEEAKELYTQEGIEPAIHGTLHPAWSTQQSDSTMHDIFNDRLELERLFCHPVRGGAYPFGAYNDRVVEQLRACGIRYCRTTDSTENTYMPTDWLRWHPTCHHGNPKLMEIAKKFVERDYTREPRLFYVWGHSYEFRLFNNDDWSGFEEFCDYMGATEGIWNATNGEIYEYCQAFNALDFTLDGDVVYNPTCTEVWFCVGKEVYSVKPGETLRF